MTDLSSIFDGAIGQPEPERARAEYRPNKPNGKAKLIGRTLSGDELEARKLALGASVERVNGSRIRKARQEHLIAEYIYGWIASHLGTGFPVGGMENYISGIDGRYFLRCWRGDIYCHCDQNRPLIKRRVKRTSFAPANSWPG